MTNEQIAQVVHEANRALQTVQGESYVSQGWNDVHEEIRESAVDGVENVLAGGTPEQSHESWMAFKEKNGWKYGEERNDIEKTHPCMVPYNELPESQQVKDHLFVAIVRTLAGELVS